MASLNKVILLGNLTRDPEIKNAPSGTPVAKLRIAVNEQFRDRATNQLKEVACYVDVTVWDKQAEACATFLQKGSQIIVDGRLTYEEWKTSTGENRNRLSVRADRIQFLNKKVARSDVASGDASMAASAPAQDGASAVPPAPIASSDEIPF